MNKLFTCRKIKSRRKSLVKERKKRKTGPKKKVRESFCEAISIGRAPRWRPDLDKEVASNYNFESCLSIRFLAPQHLLQFFHFCRGFYLCLFATLPIIVPPSSTLQWAIEIKKKVSSMGYFSREIFILRYWRQDQWNLRLSAHRRNHDSTLDWMLWESEKVFNSRVFCYNEMQSLFPM